MNSTTMQEVRFLILFVQTSGKENCRRAIYSGVARGVAGVAEATPIIQFLFNKFGQKIRVKKSYLLLATPISKSYLPPWLSTLQH